MVIEETAQVFLADGSVRQCCNATRRDQGDDRAQSTGGGMGGGGGRCLPDFRPKWPSRSLAVSSLPKTYGCCGKINFPVSEQCVHNRKDSAG